MISTAMKSHANEYGASTEHRAMKEFVTPFEVDQH